MYFNIVTGKDFSAEKRRLIGAHLRIPTLLVSIARPKFMILRSSEEFLRSSFYCASVVYCYIMDPVETAQIILNFVCRCLFYGKKVNLYVTEHGFYTAFYYLILLFHKELNNTL